MICNDTHMITSAGDQVQADAPEWLTRKEVMQHLRIGSAHTLRKAIDEDGLPFHMLRNEMRFDRGEVDAWLKSRCIDVAPDQKGAA